MAVDAAVLGNEVLHEVDREHARGTAGGQRAGEAADAGAKLHHALANHRAQHLQDLRRQQHASVSTSLPRHQVQ